MISKKNFIESFKKTSRFIHFINYGINLCIHITIAYLLQPYKYSLYKYLTYVFVNYYLAIKKISVAFINIGADRSILSKKCMIHLRLATILPFGYFAINPKGSFLVWLGARIREPYILPVRTSYSMHPVSITSNSISLSSLTGCSSSMTSVMFYFRVLRMVIL